MPGKTNSWTRRQFAQAVAASGAYSFVRRSFAAGPDEPHGYACVGSHHGTLHMFQVSGSRWRAVQTLPSLAPAHIEPHPYLPVLYLVHAVDLWDHLPRGAVSVYRVDAAGGHLSFLHTQPLSLSATLPRHAAVSPDGRHLLIAAGGGGILNLLPIAADGSLEPPRAIYKEFGTPDHATARIAAPRQVVFHPDGRLVITADPGRETISTFDIDQASIRSRQSACVHAGAGPSRIAFSPFASCLYAQNAHDGSIAVHRTESGNLSFASSLHPSRRLGPAQMAMHPAGTFLVSDSPDAFTSFAIDPGTGHLATVAEAALQDPLEMLVFSPRGDHLLGYKASSGHVVQIAFDSASGVLSAPQIVAHVEAASSLLFLPV